MALNTGPFGTYPDVTNVVSVAAQTEIIALLTELKTLIPGTPSAFSAGSGTPVGAVSEAPMQSPEFDAMRQSDADKLVAEIDAISAAIDAAPTS